MQRRTDEIGRQRDGMEGKTDAQFAAYLSPTRRAFPSTRSLPWSPTPFHSFLHRFNHTLLGPISQVRARGKFPVATCYGRRDRARQGFLVLSTLAATTDGGLRRSGNWTEGGGRLQTKFDYPISLYLYLQLHAYIGAYMKRVRKVQGEGR